MSPLSNAATALLGLLSEKSMYPYQIEKEVKYRDMRSWTELSMSSIYKLLRKLEKEELVEQKTTISPQNRIQKLYSLSKKGKMALEEKLLSILRVPEHTRWQVDIGTYNSGLLAPAQIKESLLIYREELLKRIKGYEDLLDFLMQSHCPQHRFAVAIRPVYLLRAEIEWVDSFIEEL